MYYTQIPDYLELGDIPIYYSKKYLSQLKPEVRSFCALENETKKLLLVLHFQIDNDKAISLKDAPFGGIYRYQSIDQTVIEEFLKYVVEELKQIGIRQITIKTAPSFYSSMSTLDPFSCGSQISSKRSTDINHHISIDQSQLIDRLSPMQKRRLKKCTDAQFTFKQEEPSKLEPIFQFINECRKDKNHSISVTFDKMKSTLDLFPENYLIFSCYDGHTLVAATICVIVNSKMLYHFLPASAVTYNRYSPMVFLISNIYQFCQKNHFDILDLGTSMLNNQPNENLIAFKTRIGGVQTERYSYEMNLLAGSESAK